MPGWHSVTDVFKTPQSTSPHYLFHSRKPHASSHLDSSVCFCVQSTVCPCLAFVLNPWDFNAKQLCMSWLIFFVECNLGKGRNDRSLIWCVDCVRPGFHSAVMCWFVITGLDRLVLRKQSLSSRTESLFERNRSYWSRQVIRGLYLICVYPNLCINQWN